MSTALVLPLIAAMEEAKSESLAESKWAFGIFAFVALAGLLVITLIFGKGRPHS